MRKKPSRRLLALCLFSAVVMSAWAQRVSFKVNRKPLKTAVIQFKKATGYSFVFSSNNLDLQKKVTVDANDQPLSAVVDKMLKGQNVDYEIQGKLIVVKEKKAQNITAPFTNNNQQNNKIIKGRIVDTNGEPVIGAVVKSNDGTTGAVTDINGNFSLNVPVGSTLSVSYVGYKSMNLKAQQSMNITMVSDNKELDEVVVVGYGTQRKINLTGSVAVIDGKNLVDRPVANLSQLLQGAAPGVNATMSGGQPGDGASINIRGIGSISGDASPLILIDGLESSINDVNPYDVESISVLKDASSAAVYGARAAYGVILITTKSGQDGKAHISYSGQYGFGDITTKHDFETRGYYWASIVDMFFRTQNGKNYTNYNDEDYYELWIRRNDKTENPERPWVVMKQGKWKHYANFDWYNYYYNLKRPTWQHNVTINGGNKKLSYLMSGGFYSQDGFLRHDTDNFTRFNYRLKLKAQITDWLSVSNNTTYFRSKYHYPGPRGVGHIFGDATIHNPASLTPTNPDGTAVYLTDDIDGYNLANGYPAIIEYGKNTNSLKRNNFYTTFEAVLTPIKHFTLTANYSYYFQHRLSENRQVKIPYSQTPGVIEYIPSIKDNYYEATSDHYYNGYNIFGTYENTWDKAHHVTVMGGVNYETVFNKGLNVDRDDLLSEDLSDFNLAKGDQMNIAGGKTRYALLGFFGRLNYDYLGRYLFEASGRYDGTSRFPRHHRYGFFPSFSAGWRISEESFFQPLREVFDNVKLRLSFGSLGNQNVGYYDYIQTINSGSSIGYSFGGSQKITAASVSAPNASDLTWEKAITYNLGLDLTLLNNRLTFTGDVFIRDTKDMLMAGRDLPAVYGASSPKQNAANLRTRGYELQLTWNDHFNLAKSPLNYGVTLNFADSRTKITKFDNPNKTISQFYEGMELGSLWGYKVDGYFKTDEEAANYNVDQSYVNQLIENEVIDRGLHAGDLKYVDLDGDGKIQPTTSANNLKDQRIIGNSLPRWTYSGNIHAEWRGIGVSAMWQGVIRQHWYPGPETYLFWGPYTRSYVTFIPTDFLSKVWSEDNPNAYFPRPRGYVALLTRRELSEVNTKYLQNAGYCRLKNLTISYSLPKKWLKKIGVETLRVYFSGENLFTISGLDTKYIDPEQASAGYSVSVNAGHRNVESAYPFSKVYSFGVNITL